jgi:hypothetical protein
MLIILALIMSLNYESYPIGTATPNLQIGKGLRYILGKINANMTRGILKRLILKGRWDSLQIIPNCHVYMWKHPKVQRTDTEDLVPTHIKLHLSQ